MVLFILSFHKSEAQHITLMCGHNQVRLDSTVKLTCSFFTDTIVYIYTDKPYEGSRLQVGLIPEEGSPSVSWHNVDDQSRCATYKTHSYVKEGCKKGKWLIMYQKKSVNIKNYIVDVGL